MNDLIATVLRASVHRFIGRLGRDPEVRFFDSGNCVATASIGINRPGAKKDDGQAPDWLKVEIWGQQGQAFADACKKGQLIDVAGRVKTERWTDRNTCEEKVQLCVTAESWALVTPPGQAPAPAPAAAQVATQAAQSLAAATGGTVSSYDDADMPF